MELPRRGTYTPVLVSTGFYATASDRWSTPLPTGLSPEEDALKMVRKGIATVPTVTVAQVFSAPEAWKKIPEEYRTDFIDSEMELRRRYLHSSLEDFTEPSIHRDNMAYLANYQKYGCENLFTSGRYMANPALYFDMLRLLPGNIRTMKEAGVLIGCGTDAGVPFCYHGTLWREMEMLHRLGFSAAEVLRCATINNAKILGMADSIGSVTVGKKADLVILDGNPLKDMEPYRKPRLVIREGRVYDPGAMDLTA